MKELNKEIKDILHTKCPLSYISELIDEIDYSSQNLDTLSQAVVQLQEHEEEIRSYRLKLQTGIKLLINERLAKLNVRP
ncbi:MAG: hypothetical protein NWE89_07460 [Candidatus Bathyarchaeota archaeon]|nr:hypothetical protein [Candidatus Bathyarchaeota archaeon]